MWPAYWGPDSGPGFLANLFMKFNVKANQNGANQALLEDVPILDDDTMLMGADVGMCDSNLREMY